MTITMDMYVTTQYSYYQGYPLNQKVAEIVFHAADIGFDSTYSLTLSGIGIDPINPNPSTQIYATIEDAIDGEKSAATNFVINSINVYSNDTYVWSGNLIYQKPDLNAVLNNKVDKVSGKDLSANDYTTTEKTKLSGIATAATSNDTDANLKNRANHTGTESADVITDGTTNKAYTATEKTKLSGIATGATVGQKAIEGTTVRANAFSVCKNFNVASGVATFHLTDDGLSTGNPLFTGGVIKDSLQFTYNDASGSFQQAAVWSNSDKTITATVNKFTTANILSGLLGQTAANGTNVRMSVLGYS